MNHSLYRRLAVHSLLSLTLSLLAAAPPLAALALGPSSPGGLTTCPIRLSEILPNALNENTGELLELYNSGATPVDLTKYHFIDGSNLQQSLVEFGTSLQFGASGLLLAPGQVGLVLDKDYAGEYNAEILQSDSSDGILLLKTSTGNLSLANTSDAAGIVAPDGTNCDLYAWSSDPGSEVTLARELGPTGLTELAPGASRSLGWLVHQAPPPTAPQVILSELLPNPSSAQEFVELYNASPQALDLSTLALRDASGKTVRLSGSLAAGSYTALTKPTTGLSLNNDGDTVELLWQLPTPASVLDKTTYTNAISDQSWAAFEEGFAWTVAPTPGAHNILDEPASPQSSDAQDATDETGEEAAPEAVQETEENATEIPHLADLASEAEGTLVSVQGVVSAARGTFYTDTLHLSDPSGAALAKVSSETRAAIGDTVTIVGKLESYAHQPRILATSLVVTGRAKVSYRVVQPGGVDESLLGQAVRLQGQVSSRSGKSFRVARATASANQKSTLVSVRKTTGISAAAPKKGSLVTVSGIVLRSGEQVVVAPRATSDISSGTKTGAALVQTGPNLGHLLEWATLAAAVLLGGWRGAPYLARALRRAARWGRSKSSLGHAAR